MQKNKRGLSSVVTTTLLILGTVVGVAILWAFISKNMGSTDEVGDSDCLYIRLEPTSCEAYGQCNYGSGVGGYNANITVTRKTGKGEITGLRFIFEDITGIKKSIDLDATINELETKSFLDPLSVPVPGGKPKSVRVAALVGEEKEVCAMVSVDKACNVLNEPPERGNVAVYPNPNPYVSLPREGFCCQYPLNECYTPNAATEIQNGKFIGSLPRGKTSVCCALNPYTGQPL